MATPLWYNTLLWLIKPFYQLRIRRKALSHTAYLAECAERFGPFYAAKNQAAIWFHAVSVGETNAAQPLIQHYLDLGYAVLLTNTTQTGQARAKALFAANYAQDFQAVYQPVDQTHLMKQFIAQHQPRVLLLIETELWPNVLAQAQHAQVPVLLCNARLSEKSARGYGKVSGLTRAMLAQLNHVLAQDDATLQRYIALGLAPEKGQVLGNIKFDIEAPRSYLTAAAQLRDAWQLHNRQIILLASTHDPEEQSVLMALKSQLQAHPQYLCIVVPRHPQRFDAVYSLITDMGFACHRRSLGESILAEQQVYLADTMGELWLWYALADVCFVGASLNFPGGGHNILEPMTLNVATVIGPRYFNFQSIVDTLLQAQAIDVAADADAVVNALLYYLQNPAAAMAVSQQAKQVLASNQGALQRHIGIIDHYLN